MGQLGATHLVQDMGASVRDTSQGQLGIILFLGNKECHAQEEFGSLLTWYGAITCCPTHGTALSLAVLHIHMVMRHHLLFYTW